MLRFPPLLQSDFLQTFSVPVPTALRRRFCATLRSDLEASRPERGRELLSGEPLFSEA
ncbi:MAG: hypothetical protein AVDCRST_MAG04-3770 [uncultured Acetobacteraceae bacterium]|uniref:Uncharacterized protein n=1 Tax=uncultured Acetobacteraceae bacterium TaxID=169975 RepID=A0A6J4JLK4_9PROT|nr:MAG: hypothetical protein AVDCRST_MAG04-3770 [uncultured Acetobacteraceae bacterium]